MNEIMWEIYSRNDQNTSVVLDIIIIIVITMIIITTTIVIHLQIQSVTNPKLHSLPTLSGSCNSRSKTPRPNKFQYSESSGREVSHGVTLDMCFNQSVTFVWILTGTNIRIYSCQENKTNKYPNIFVWNFLTWTNIRIYLYQNFDTNEYPNKYLDRKYSNIRIYSSLSGLD